MCFGGEIIIHSHLRFRGCVAIEGDAAGLRKRRDLRNPLDPDLAQSLVTAAIYHPRLCEAPSDLIISVFYEFGGGLWACLPVNTNCNFLVLVFISSLHRCRLAPRCAPCFSAGQSLLLRSGVGKEGGENYRCRVLSSH